jgi:flavodoxin
MKILVLYGSKTGNTRLVANRLPGMLNCETEVVNVASITNADHLLNYGMTLYLASTWGDGELQLDMELFFSRNKVDLHRQPYAICELGNYYGYDDFEFGALNIMRHHVEGWNACEVVEPFSMDSLPHKDWKNLGRWCDRINMYTGGAHG